MTRNMWLLIIAIIILLIIAIVLIIIFVFLSDNTNWQNLCGGTAESPGFPGQRAWYNVISMDGEPNNFKLLPDLPSIPWSECVERCEQTPDCKLFEKSTNDLRCRMYAKAPLNVPTAPVYYQCSKGSGDSYGGVKKGFPTQKGDP